jgi:hypothetical protein
MGQLLMPIAPATQEVEIGKGTVCGQLWTKSTAT